jgi:hypothetical protein
MDRHYNSTSSALFLLTVASYFAWLIAKGYRSGRVSIFFGDKHDFRRESDSATYWIVLSWYFAIATLSVFSAMSML